MRYMLLPGSVNTHELSIKPEQVDRLYRYFVDERLIVNRRYQRKLVWDVTEKRQFIDSLANGYPVPLILFAEIDGTKYEIIDGMQRLDAITSFIEGAFEYNGSYFDLETMVTTKARRDSGALAQKTPVLQRNICERIANYTLAISSFPAGSEGAIDTVFRRINAGGRNLSQQELRTAGALGYFAQLVRRVSSQIRGDVSFSEILPLNAMNRISITNRDLPYGIDVNNVWWVKQGVLSRDRLRQSRDEELVADLLLTICSGSIQPTRTEILDEVFKATDDTEQSARYTKTENTVLTIGAEALTKRFIEIFDVIGDAASRLGEKFSELIMQGDAAKDLPRYYQAVFLGIDRLMHTDGLRIADFDRFDQLFASCGTKLNIAGGGGTWSSEDKIKNVEAIHKHLKRAFRKAGIADVAIDNWKTELENILRQSFTEQTQFDFKQGLLLLDGKNKPNEEAFSRLICTATAIANYGPSARGYILIGVADNETDALRVRDLYSVDVTCFDRFFITGVEHEAKVSRVNLDTYYTQFVNRIKQQPIPSEFADILTRNVKNIRYGDKSVFVLQIDGLRGPVYYAKDFFIRSGASTVPVPTEAMGDLFARFSSSSTTGSSHNGRELRHDSSKQQVSTASPQQQPVKAPKPSRKMPKPSRKTK